MINKSLLLCEFEDPELNFDGDTGAIGRMVLDGTSSLTFDLKGRQYSGAIRSGPTVIILNFAPPVGVKDLSSQAARAEYITNEYCHLKFEKDLLSDLKGVYTG